MTKIESEGRGEPTFTKYLVSLLAAIMLLGLLWFGSELSSLQLVNGVVSTVSSFLLVVFCSVNGRDSTYWLFWLFAFTGVASTLILIYFDLVGFSDSSAAGIKVFLLLGYLDLFSYVYKKGKPSKDQSMYKN